jgi:hypothetical protein
VRIWVAWGYRGTQHLVTYTCREEGASPWDSLAPESTVHIYISIPRRR